MMIPLPRHLLSLQLDLIQAHPLPNLWVDRDLNYDYHEVLQFKGLKIYLELKH